MYSENILPSMNVVKKIISGSVSKLQASWNMIFVKQAKLENNYFWKGKKYWDVFLEKAFEMYVWGCVLREAYYFCYDFWTGKLKNKMIIDDFSKSTQKWALPSCILCHCLPLDSRGGHLISQSLFSPANMWNYINFIFT